MTVLTGIPNYPTGKVFDTYRKQPDAFVLYEGARVVRVPMLPRGTGSLRLMLNYLSFVLGGIGWGAWLLRGIKADVIFVFEPSPVTVGLPALWLGKIKKIPVVFWALDLWPETLSAVGFVQSPLILNWVGHMVRFIYDRCSLILGQSRGFLDNIAKYCSDKRKIRYFPNWAEDVFSEAYVVPAPEVIAKPNGFTILFAGNIGEAQDMPAILDAAEYLRGCQTIRWVIVGDGRKFDWLHGEVQRRGLREQVLLTGRFPVERMPSFYAHADALLVSLKCAPVFSMTIPGKVQSYLMTGIPLLGMLDGEGVTVIREANAGLTCNPGDGIALAKAALALAAMPSVDRKQMGLNGREYAQKEFGKTQLIERLEVLLNEAVTESKAKARL